MVNGPVMVKGNCTVAVAPFASATWNPIVGFPAADGVPLMPPVPDLKVRPDCSVPEFTVQVKGEVPPVAAKVAL